VREVRDLIAGVPEGAAERIRVDDALLERTVAAARSSCPRPQHLAGNARV
jgi:hypothetical protein